MEWVETLRERTYNTRFYDKSYKLVARKHQNLAAVGQLYVNNRDFAQDPLGCSPFYYQTYWLAKSIDSQWLPAEITTLEQAFNYIGVLIRLEGWE